MLYKFILNLWIIRISNSAIIYIYNIYINDNKESEMSTSSKLSNVKNVRLNIVSNHESFQFNWLINNEDIKY